MTLELTGLYPSTALSMSDDLRILERDLTVHVQRLAVANRAVSGVVVNDHVGQVAALTRDERQRVVAVAREVAPRNFHVIAGVASLSTAEAIELAADAKDAGADAALVMSPLDSYARWGSASAPEVPYRHFASIADAVDLPLVVLQYPVSSGLSYTTDTLVRLADLGPVVAVQNACGDVATYIEQFDALKGRVNVLAASEGPELFAMLAYGADGAVVGAANVATKLWARVVTGAIEGRLDAVRDDFFDKLVPLSRALTRPTRYGALASSALTREAMVQMGFVISSAVRPPDIDVTDDDRKMVHEGLQRAGLLG